MDKILNISVIKNLETRSFFAGVSELLHKVRPSFLFFRIDSWFV